MAKKKKNLKTAANGPEGEQPTISAAPKIEDIYNREKDKPVYTTFNEQMMSVLPYADSNLKQAVITTGRLDALEKLGEEGKIYSSGSEIGWNQNLLLHIAGRIEEAKIRGTQPVATAPALPTDEAERRILKRGERVTEARLKREKENIEIESMMQTHGVRVIAEKVGLLIETTRSRIKKLKQNSP
jgi:hypothetical protein